MHLHELRDRRPTMITARTLILGSAAALVAMSGAQAADLPLKAKAVEYVKVLLPIRRWLLLHPGHRHLRQARRLPARRHHVQRRHLRQPGLDGDLGQHNRYANYYRVTFAYGLHGRYPHRHRIRRCPHLRPGRLAVLDARRHHQNPNSLNTTLGNNTNLLDTPGGGYVACRIRVHPVRRLHLR